MSGILNLVLIGAKSSGKTIYLSTLWGKGLLLDTNTETKKYLKNTWNYIEEHKKAQATSGMFKILNFSYSTNEEFGRLNFSIDDYDGTFTETNSQEDENSKEEREKLLNSVKKSEGCIFFIPYESSSERLKDFAQEIDAFIKLAQFETHNKSPIPASIIITKWDESDNFKAKDELLEAEKYIENSVHLKRVVKLIKDNFKHTKLIPISSFKKYQLLKPIDFSLENTFKQWHERAVELKEKSNFQKLTHFLSLRYDDIKFNETYNFTEIYDESQEKFAIEIANEFQTLKTYQKKEEYLKNHQDHFKTKENLLTPFRNEIKKERRDAKIKKNIKRVLSILGLSAIGLLTLMYQKSVNINEAFDNLISKNNKGIEYQDVRNDIDKFLQEYPSDNFLLSFSDIKNKRKELNDIKNNLQIQYTDSMNKEVEQLSNTNNKLSPAEKLQTLNQLQLSVKKGSSSDKKIQSAKAQLELQQTTKNWSDKAHGCLKTCDKEESGVQIIESLLNESQKIIENAENSNLLVKLQDLKNKILTQNEITTNLKNIQNITTLNKLTTFKFKNFNTDIKTNIILKLEELHPEYFRTFEGTKILDGLKDINKKEDFKKYVKNDVKKFIENNENFSNLKKDIEDTEKFINLDKLEYDAYSQFDDNQKSQIEDLLNREIDDFFKSLKEGLPSDKVELNLMSDWLNKANHFKEFSIDSIGYKYKNKDNFRYISEKYKEYKDIKSLKDNGLKHISVLLKWDNKNDNELGLTSTNSEVTIEGFTSSTLTHENSKKSDNSILFKDKISLKSENSYLIDLIENEKLWPNKKITHTIYISIKELYKLSKENKDIEKDIDSNKLKLIFSKSNQ